MRFIVLARNARYGLGDECSTSAHSFPWGCEARHLLEEVRAVAVLDRLLAELGQHQRLAQLRRHVRVDVYPPPREAQLVLLVGAAAASEGRLAELAQGVWVTFQLGGHCPNRGTSRAVFMCWCAILFGVPRMIIAHVRRKHGIELASCEASKA